MEIGAKPVRVRGQGVVSIALPGTILGIGLGLLYSRVTHSRGRVWASRALWGWILLGWGLFNLLEGVVDHHILGIHHVRSGEYQTWWDIGFLVFGALLVAGGWLLQRNAAPVDVCNPDDLPEQR